jgi:hypothetical protein
MRLYYLHSLLAVLAGVVAFAGGCAPRGAARSPATVPAAQQAADTPPSPATQLTSDQGVDKPEIISAEQWGSKPQPIDDARRQVPKFITIHHAGVLWKGTIAPDQFIRNMQGWGQREKHWPDLAYHFLIAPDGRIYEGRSIDYEPESNTKYPLNGHIGIELMGNFEEQRVSLEQLASLVKLCAWLAQAYHIDPSQIAGHKDRAEKQTVCPGRDLYRYIADGSIQQWVRALRQGREADVALKDALPAGPTTMITLRAPSTRPE